MVAGHWTVSVLCYFVALAVHSSALSTIYIELSNKFLLN